LVGAPYVHDHDLPGTVVDSLVSACHENLRPDDTPVVKTIEVKCIDRTVAVDETSEVSAKIFVVLAPEDVSKQVLTEDLGRRLSQAIFATWPRIEYRPLVR
jgi:hypothetical protein